jgi:phosphatidate cytidylyltransferase
VKRTTVHRLATSLVGVPAAFGVVFFAPGDLAFVVFFLLVFWAASEFIRLAYAFAPSAPLGVLLLLIPVASLGGFAATRFGEPVPEAGWWFLAGATLLALIATAVTLLAATKVSDGLNAIGILVFAVPYFAAPPVLLYHLQILDPWVLFVYLAMVWTGDSAAYTIGSWIGRRKLAPSVSPNKSWEGAIASFVACLLVAAIWSLWRLQELRWEWLAVAGLTGIAAQLGDLLESLVKRGAGVKDSGNVLPGHGGFFDRLDAILLSVPVFVVGAWLLGFDSLVPS